MRKLLFPSFVFVALAAFQVWLLSTLTVFLTPEFSLYPYFFSKDLLPYRQIIDQHFPTIFFGPLNLGFLGLTDPNILICFFIFLILLINLEFWLLLKTKTTSLLARGLLQLGLIFSLVILGVNHLWLEALALCFILAALLLIQKNRTLPALMAGFLFGLTALTRPLLLPLLFLLWLRTNARLKLILGGLVAVTITLGWLTFYGLWPEFLDILRFNGQTYAAMAVQTISRGDLLKLLWVAGWLGLTISKPDWLLLLAIPAALLPSYPRFELFHNLLLVSLPAWPKVEIRVHPLAKIWLVVGLLLAVRQTGNEPDVSYYYPNELYQEAQDISKYQAGQIYFFGGPDQLYYLTNSLPPEGFYLPSLPWYHARAEWIDREIDALANNPQALVVINPQSRVGTADLLHYSQRLYLFIRANYQLIGETGPLQIWGKTQP